MDQGTLESGRRPPEVNSLSSDLTRGGGVADGGRETKDREATAALSRRPPSDLTRGGGVADGALIK